MLSCLYSIAGSLYGYKENIEKLKAFVQNYFALCNKND